MSSIENERGAQGCLFHILSSKCLSLPEYRSWAYSKSFSTILLSLFERTPLTSHRMEEILLSTKKLSLLQSYYPLIFNANKSCSLNDQADGCQRVNNLYWDYCSHVFLPNHLAMRPFSDRLAGTRTYEYKSSSVSVAFITIGSDVKFSNFPGVSLKAFFIRDASLGFVWCDRDLGQAQPSTYLNVHLNDQ